MKIEKEPDKIRMEYNNLKPYFQNFGKKINEILEFGLKKQNILHVPTQVRIKTFDSFLKKILRKEEYFKNPFGTINDLLGVRVITFIKADLITVSKIIENEFEILEGPDDKSERLNNREFGYRSIHYIVKLNEKRAELLECSDYKDLRAEIQIRTNIENAWAEVEHHWNYKPDKKDVPLDKTLQRRLSALMAVLELVDQEFNSIREGFQNKFKSDEIMLKAIKNFTGNPDLFNTLCNYLIDNENYEELVHFTKEAVTAENDNVNVWHLMAIGLLYLENYEELLELSNKLIELEPNVVLPYSLKGYTFSNLDKHSKALLWYEKALKLEPKNTLALVNKGRALNDLGKYEDAIEWINKALDIKPEYTYALGRKGLVLRNLKRFEEAIQLFDKSLDIVPEDTETLVNKGVVLAELGILEEAIQSFDKAIELEPEFILALVNKTIALADLGKYEEALEWIDRALEVEPENIRALMNKARVLDGLGKIGEAINLFSRAYQYGPEEFYFKETILNKSKKLEEAIQLLNKKLEPEQEDIQIIVGISYSKLGNHMEAIKWYNSVLQNNPKNRKALMWKSVALVKLEKYEDALKTLKGILNNNPEYAFVLYMRARIQLLIGNDELALENLTSAINLDKQFKSIAREDPVFETIKESKEFKKITS